jgi:hypothetical protein
MQGERCGTNVQLVGVMLCMACGGKMRLAKVDQTEAGLIPGFAHHTFECTSCQDVERRLMLAGAATREPFLATDAAPPVFPEPVRPNDGASSVSPALQQDQAAPSPARESQTDQAASPPAAPSPHAPTSTVNAESPTTTRWLGAIAKLRKWQKKDA